jgi:hypothetical protein
MKLESMIRRMILRHPSIFSNRARALDHLFCVNGTGMKWQDGEITYEPGFEDRKTRSRQRQDYIDMCAKHDKDAKERAETIAREKQMFAYIDKHIRALCHNADLNWLPPWEEFPPIHDASFYPLCQYANLVNVPDDAKPDWLAGAIEVCELILALPKMKKSKQVDMHDKQVAIWREINRQQAQQILKRLRALQAQR